MLTIQPNFTTKQYTPKVVHFKGQAEITEDYVNSQKAFYEDQIKEAEKIIDDKHTPSFLKKAMKVSKIVSEGIVEGWAVLWGALTGAKMAKNGAIKAFGSKPAKGIGKVLSKGLKFIKTGIRDLAQSGFVKNIKGKISEFAEKLNNTKYGKYIISGGNAIVNAAKTVLRYVRNGFSKVTKPIKDQGAEAIYDKTSKGVATTLGVGSGLAGSYNAVRKEEAKAGQDTMLDSEPYDADYDNEEDNEIGD